jgi:putative sterol carrier protein
MSDVITAAVEKLNERLGGGFDGTAKFTIDGEGAIMVDDVGARAGDEPAEVTLSADAETFVEILDGSLNPTSAFMTGRLAVDGDMGLAMKLGAALS